jgi:hypothetical protein
MLTRASFDANQKVIFGGAPDKYASGQVAVLLGIVFDSE